MRRYILAALALVLLTSFGFKRGQIIDGQLYRYLRIFNEAIIHVQRHYVEPEKVKIKSLFHGALDGMLRALKDPYTKFLPPSLYKDTRVETRGAFGGLGIEITIKDGKLIIITPLEGTPAERVGLAAGDWITHIDGKSTEGITLQEAVKKLRGKEGTTVTVRVNREGEELEFKIVRERIKIKSVKYGFLKEGLGYLRICTFNQHTEQELLQALKSMETGGLDALVLDLRNNPGGLLEQAVAVADSFIDEGLLLYTKGRGQKIYARYEASEHRTLYHKPLVVLINKGTASAAEIVAASLKDRERATVVGTKSFGKACVQTLFPLPDGSGLCLTTAYYYTPSGLCIHEEGIKPHIEVQPLLPSKEEKKMIERLEKEGFLKDFIQGCRHPTTEDIKEFLRYLEKRDIKLSMRLLRILINRELEQRGWKKRPLFDLESDPQLQRAIKIAEDILNEEKKKGSL
jgi:carboxyl-terminal processing protease